MGLFGGGGDTFGGANSYLEQMKKYTDQYMNPYIDKGQGAMNILYDKSGQLINDPNAVYNKMAAGYTQSPGYQYNLDQATNASNNAAAAGGFVGSPAQQQEMQKTASGLASQDFNQYMNNQMSLFNTGMGSMGNINQMGFGASTNALNSINQMLQAQAQLKYSSDVNKNQSSGGLLGSAIGALGNIKW